MERRAKVDGQCSILDGLVLEEVEAGQRESFICLVPAGDQRSLLATLQPNKN